MGSRGSEYIKDGAKGFDGSITSATNFDELQTALEQRLGKVTIDEELKEYANFEIVKKGMEAVDKMVEMFPILEGQDLDMRLIPTSVDKGGVINKMRWDGTIWFSKKYYDKENPMLLDAIKEFDGKSHPKNFSPEQCISHELGHYISALYLKKMNPYFNSLQMEVNYGVVTYRDLWVGVYKQMGKNGYTGSIISMFKNISKYATRTWEEGGAEAIADVFSNGDNANEASKLFVDALQQELKKYQ